MSKLTQDTMTVELLATVVDSGYDAPTITLLCPQQDKGCPGRMRRVRAIQGRPVGRWMCSQCGLELWITEKVKR